MSICKIYKLGFIYLSKIGFKVREFIYFEGLVEGV